ncbi:hypothetical protein EDD22DRAFT_956571 [Suillus occidentalis]|nr:hypothetical protein EDD22DRAFT_956571 [Suillus occidentalis]
MHKHLSLQLNGPSNALPTPPSTQNAVSSGMSSSTQPPTAESSSTDPNIQGASRAVPSQPLQAAMQQPVQQQAVTVALPAGPTAPHTQNPPPAQPADEIAALKARIAELEHGIGHCNMCMGMNTSVALHDDPRMIKIDEVPLSFMDDQVVGAEVSM